MSPLQVLGLVVLVGAAACEAASGEGADAGADSGVDIAMACACELQEKCLPCYQHLGRCCYDDQTIFGEVIVLAETCERAGDCAACCNECLQRSCEELIAGNACPARVPP